MPRLPKIAIPGPGLFNTHRGLIEYLARVPKLYIQPGNSIILLPYPQVVFTVISVPQRGHHMSESLAVGRAAAPPAVGTGAPPAVGAAADAAAAGDPRRQP